MAQRLLDYFEETRRPDNKFEQVCSEPPFFEAHTREKAIEDEPIYQ
jgi:hypothetical protein